MKFLGFVLGGLIIGFLVGTWIGENDFSKLGGFDQLLINKDAYLRSYRLIGATIGAIALGIVGWDKEMSSSN